MWCEAQLEQQLSTGVAASFRPTSHTADADTLTATNSFPPSAADAGAWIELEFSTAEGSGAPAGGSGAEVILGYLRSYQKMGLARVECRSGCTCPPSVMDGLWGDHTSLQQMHSFRASQAQRCRLRVTIVPRGGGGKGGGAAGDKFQLSAAMVAHAPVAIGTYARQVADFNKLV